MGWNRHCTQLILYLELLNRWTESFYNQHIKENILNMPVFQITIFKCFQSVILYITIMRFLHEVSYLFLKAQKYLSIKIQPPMKANCTCQSKHFQTHSDQNSIDQREGFQSPVISSGPSIVFAFFFNNSTLWETEPFHLELYIHSPTTNLSQQALATQFYYGFSIPILLYSLFLKILGKCFQK